MNALILLAVIVNCGLWAFFAAFGVLLFAVYALHYEEFGPIVLFMFGTFCFVFSWRWELWRKRAIKKANEILANPHKYDERDY